MADYYKQLQDHPDRARQVGWRDRYHQAVRFEAVIDAIGPNAAVVDLGCGLADLARYVDERDLSWRYLGVDLSAELASRAYTPERVVVGDYRRADRRVADAARDHLGAVDWVVGIGALVSGTDLGDNARRRANLVALCERAASLASAGWVLSVIDQEALRRRPGLGAEGALGGATKRELVGLAQLFDASLTITPLFEVEMVAVFRPRSAGNEGVGHDTVDDAATDLGAVSRWLKRALEHPWSATAEPIDRAWLWYRVGDLDNARGWLDRAAPSGRARLLNDALNNSSHA